MSLLLTWHLRFYDAQDSVSLYLKIAMRENWDYYVDDYEHNYLLGCDIVKYGRIALTFQSNVTTLLPVYRALHARRQSSWSIIWLVRGYETLERLLYVWNVCMFEIKNSWEIPNLHCGWWRDGVQLWVQYVLAWCAPGLLVPDAHSLHPVHCHIQSIL